MNKSFIIITLLREFIIHITFICDLETMEKNQTYKTQM